MAKRKPSHQSPKHEPASPPRASTNKFLAQPEETSPLFAPPPQSVMPPAVLSPNGVRTPMDLLKFNALLESFGITDRDFISPLYSQLIEADGFGGDGVEFAAAVIKGIRPRDQLEAMLAAQMAVMHWASMKCMRQVADRRGTPFQEPAVAMATKLARTFAAEMEVLKRYRSGGEQKVTVRHVVEKEEQAVVNTVTHTTADATPLLSDLRASAKPVPGDLGYEEQAWHEYVARKKTSSP